MTDTQLNAGIVAYVHHGAAVSPRQDPEAVLVIDPVGAETLLPQVEAVVAESLEVPIDWSTVTLGDAGRQMASVMHERYPELSREALDALAWN
jgi:hypothetical protein